MDLAYLSELQKIRETLGEGFSRAVNSITSLFISPVLYLIFALIYWCVNKRKGIFYIFCLAGGNFLNTVLKTVFCVFRPWLVDSRIRPYEFTLEDASGYSFPSGHATAAGSIFGALARMEKKKKWLTAVCIGLCLLIGFSRNFLGVHTPQDVLAGFATSAVCIWGFGRMLPWIDRKDGRDTLVTAIALLLLTGGLILAVLRRYPLTLNGEQVLDEVTVTKDIYTAIGIGYGLILGWYTERKRIGFEPDGSLKKRILRGALGTVGIGIVYLLPKQLMYTGLGDNWGRLVLYFITVFYVMAGWPWIDKKILRSIDKE